MTELLLQPLLVAIDADRVARIRSACLPAWPVAAEQVHNTSKDDHPTAGTSRGLPWQTPQSCATAICDGMMQLNASPGFAESAVEVRYRKTLR